MSSVGHINLTLLCCNTTTSPLRWQLTRLTPYNAPTNAWPVYSAKLPSSALHWVVDSRRRGCPRLRCKLHKVA